MFNWGGVSEGFENTSWASERRLLAVTVSIIVRSGASLGSGEQSGEVEWSVDTPLGEVKGQDAVPGVVGHGLKFLSK